MNLSLLLKICIVIQFISQYEAFVDFDFDSNFDCDRIVRYFRHLIDGKKGIPDLIITDPMPMPDFQIEKSTPKMNAQFKKSFVYGTSNFVISRIYVDMVKMKVKIAINFTQINVSGEYSLRANAYFMSISGEGPFSMNLTKIYITCTIDLTSDEMGQILISDVNTDLSIKDLKVHFENLGAWSKFSNAIINALSSSMLSQMKPTINFEVKKQAMTKGNDVLAKLPPQSILFNPLYPIDVVLIEVCDQLESMGFDPKTLENRKWAFERTILFVKFYGSVNLFDGFIKGIKTLHRTGEVEALFTNGSLQLRMRMGFDELQIGYKMAIEFQGLEQIGGVHALVESVDVELVLTIEHESKPPSVKEFRVVDIRQMTLDVDGLGSLDSIVEFISNSFTNVFKHQLTQVVESDVMNIIRERLEVITLNDTCHLVIF